MKVRCTQGARLTTLVAPTWRVSAATTADPAVRFAAAGMTLCMLGSARSKHACAFQGCLQGDGLGGFKRSVHNSQVCSNETQTNSAMHELRFPPGRSLIPQHRGR